MNGIYKILISPLLLLFIFQCSIVHSISAQYDSLHFCIRPIDAGPGHAAWSIIKQELKYVSGQQIRKKMQQLRRKLQEVGYLEAAYQEVKCQQDSCFCPLQLGPRYEWASLENGNIPEKLLNAIDFREQLYQNKPFHYTQVGKLQKALLDYCENNGFPFAQVFIDSIRFDSLHRLSARLYLDIGAMYHYDELEVQGKKNKDESQKVRISKNYLSNYLDIRKDQLYDEAQIQKIKKRLREIPFLNSYRDPLVLFVGEKARPILFLENRRASKFDILFGLLPNNNASPQEPKLNFTGNVNIDLFNPFGTGKRIIAQWQQYQVGRSEMRFAFAWPYLVNTPIGLDLKFELYRRDSTYIDIISDVGLQYLFDGNNYLKVFWKNSTTNVQNIDTTRVLNSRRLPQIIDLRNNTFGVSYYQQRLDYRWNPTKGFELKTTLGFGIKSIRPNSAIQSLKDPSDPSFDFSSLYDSISRRSFQYNIEADFAYYLPLFKNSTLMNRLRSGFLYNSQNNLYTNEMYRIGGHQMMRGFDEQSIFGSWYNVSTTELRYLLGNNSYAYTFGDFSYIEHRTAEALQAAWRYGFGVGLALDTKVGIFALSYALGSEFGTPLILRNGKIHFGYVNIF